jgi:hypothetical protein
MIEDFAHLFGDDFGLGLGIFMLHLLAVAFCGGHLMLESDFHDVCEEWNLGADTSWDIYKLFRDNKVVYFVPV